MKIVLAPDSFKNTMSADVVCSELEAGIREVLPEASVICLPAADGGEGTIDAILGAMGGKRVYLTVTGSEFGLHTTSYGQTNDDTAIIEMAEICGLMLTKNLNPEKTTTLGVGEAIVHALDNGCKKIILCIGGSSTNDAGMGVMEGLGACFLDNCNRPLPPVGESLKLVEKIDLSKLDSRLKNTEILIACDVDNPLYGKNGAAFVYAPQKGADSEMVVRLDEGLRHFSEILFKESGIAVENIPGMGAAGGISSGLYAFCGASLRSGVDIVLDTIKFDACAKNADLVITGEGKTDFQTLSGKVPIGVAKRCAAKNIPVVVVSGSVDGNAQQALYDAGVWAVFPSILDVCSFDMLKPVCRQWLKATARNIIRAIILFQK